MAALRDVVVAAGDRRREFVGGARLAPAGCQGNAGLGEWVDGDDDEGEDSAGGGEEGLGAALELVRNEEDSAPSAAAGFVVQLEVGEGAGIVGEPEPL